MSDNNAPTYYVVRPGWGNIVAPGPLDDWRGRSKKQEADEKWTESYLQTVATIRTVSELPDILKG